MPELPDVEIARRFIADTSLGRPIADVEVLDLRPLGALPAGALADALRGREFVTTSRRGKWLFAEAEDGPWLVLHLRMTGSLGVTDPGESAPPYTRVSFRFADGGALHFRDPRRFGVVGLTADPKGFAAQHHLGPDALDAGLTLARFDARLARKRSALKATLLDQSFVAGVGSIYGDEICHAAGLSPTARTQRLSAEDRRAVYRAMRGVLKTAVDRMAEDRPLPRTWLILQRHEGGRCPRCGEPVARVRVQGRYSWWCPCSQRTP